MIKDKKLTKNFIWNTIGSTFNAFNSVFILIFITRINGLEDAGTFSIAFATASILYVFAIYSGRNCQITNIKEDIKDNDYIIGRSITCIITIILMFLYIAVSHYENSKVYILVSLCLWKILEAFSDALYGTLQKYEQLYKAGISLSIKSLIGILLFLIIDILTFNLKLSFTFLYLTNFIVIVLYDIPNTKRLTSGRYEIKNIISIYKNEFWLFANTALIMYMLNVPKYIIEKYLTADIQAIFAIILMPASIITLFAQFILAPIISKITYAYKEKNIKKMKKISIKTTTLILGFGFLATLIGYLIGIPVLNIIYSQNLNPYKMNFVIILLAYILYGIAYVNTITLTVFRKLKEQFVVHIIAAFLINIFSHILIRNFGIGGASVTYLIIMMIYYILLSAITKYNYIKEERKINK